MADRTTVVTRKTKPTMSRDDLCYVLGIPTPTGDGARITFQYVDGMGGLFRSAEIDQIASVTVEFEEAVGAE